MINNFAKILTKISNGETVEQIEIVPFLISGQREDRLKINIMLALSYFQQENASAKKQAAIFINRAWTFSGFDEDILPLYEKINISLDRIDEVKKAYKRLFTKNIDTKNYDLAGKYFDMWQNTYSLHKHLDKYEYDYDVINYMTKLSEEFKIYPVSKNASEKKRLAYFITGLSEVNSVLLKIDMLFAKHHNKERYEVAFFSLNTKDEIEKSAQGIDYLNDLKKFNVDTHFSKNTKGRIERILSLADKVNEFCPDLLIADVAMRNFDHYFLTLVLSEYKILCFNQGPPPQFIPPHATWNIAWTKHPLIDSPVSGSLVALEFELFNGNDIQAISKNELGVPENSFVIICAGRTQKFQDLNYWRAIGKILIQNPEVYFFAVGIEKNNAPDYSSFISEEIQQRIKYFGWQNNYLKLLKSADLLLDTYPSGGGVVLIDAMALCIPILFFTNDYMHEYDQTDWSPAEELIGVTELAVPRGNFDAFLNRANEIIRNNDLRLSLGKKCLENISDFKGNPLRMVRKCEEIYDMVIDGRNEEKVMDRNSEDLDYVLKKIEENILSEENYKQWQKAYQDGYNSDLGDHSLSFYNDNLAGLGLYELINNSKKIIEYGPSNASFMKKFIEIFPEKKFYLAEYLTGLTNKLKREFSANKNVEVFLNHPEISSLSSIDLSFSFLLSQSMPKTLWINHLRNVKTMLSKNGSYIFQFAYHPTGFADDQIQNGIYGNNKYKPEEIYKMLEEAGYNGCDLSVPITLERLNSDIVWYFCKAY